MKSKSIFAAAILTVAASAPAFAQHFTGSNLVKYATISPAKASAIALAAVPGTITDQELEREGNGLRYSFDIKAANKTYEVGVDAKTGKVIEKALEGKNPD